MNAHELTDSSHLPQHTTHNRSCVNMTCCTELKTAYSLRGQAFRKALCSIMDRKGAGDFCPTARVSCEGFNRPVSCVNEAVPRQGMGVV